MRNFQLQQLVAGEMRCRLVAVAGPVELTDGRRPLEGGGHSSCPTQDNTVIRTAEDQGSKCQE